MSKPIKILTSVELGSPAADCAHFGICSVDVITPEQWVVFQPRHIRQVKAILSINPRGQLCFEFPIDGMLEETRVQFFPEMGFRVDSARVLPAVITELLGIKDLLYTVPGIYPLTFLANSLITELCLTNKGQVWAVAA